MPGSLSCGEHLVSEESEEGVMSSENAEGRGSRRWPIYLGILTASLLFLLIGPSICVIPDTGTSVIGVVLTTDGQRLQGATAELQAPLRPRSISPSVAESTVTDSGGCFRLFSFHHPGTVEISVKGSGFETFTTTTSPGGLSVEVVLVPIGSAESSRGHLAPSSSEDAVRARYSEKEEGAGGSDIS